MARPQFEWTAQEYEQALDITKGTREEWLRAGGPLSGAPRVPGRYTRADILIGLVALDLRVALGHSNPLVNEVMRQIQGRLASMAQTNHVPDRLTLQLGEDPGVVVVNLAPWQLLQDHGAAGLELVTA